MGKLDKLKAAANAKAQGVKNKQDQKRAAEVMKKIYDERRIKTAFVRGDFLLHWFKKGINQPSDDYITIVDGIPEDVLVLGVDYEAQVAAFVFVLGSLDFEPVPEGEVPESLKIKIKVGEAK
jgi:hypothetical protein